MTHELSSLDQPPNFRIVTACYGAKFWDALPGWARHVRAFSDAPIDIISLDQRDYVDPAAGISTLKIDGGEDMPWGAGDMPRIALVSRHLEHGIASIQMDIDVMLKRDVSPLLSLPYDFIVSRAFAFPENVAEQMGFVACTGFYIAKPGALGLCGDIMGLAASNAYGAALDQLILNMILLEAREQGLWQRRTVRCGELELAMDEFEYGGCRIGVLPKETILRSANLDGSVFGNHHPSILERFSEADASVAK